MLMQLQAKKSEIVNAVICYKSQKTHFGPLFTEKLRNKIFPQKNHLSQS